MCNMLFVQRQVVADIMSSLLHQDVSALFDGLFQKQPSVAAMLKAAAQDEHIDGDVLLSMNVRAPTSSIIVSSPWAGKSLRAVSSSPH